MQVWLYKQTSANLLTCGQVTNLGCVRGRKTTLNFTLVLNFNQHKAKSFLIKEDKKTKTENQLELAFLFL